MQSQKDVPPGWMQITALRNDTLSWPNEQLSHAHKESVRNVLWAAISFASTHCAPTLWPLPPTAWAQYAQWSVHTRCQHSEATVASCRALVVGDIPTFATAGSSQANSCQFWPEHVYPVMSQEISKEGKPPKGAIDMMACSSSKSRGYIKLT